MHGQTISQIGEDLLLSHPSISKTLRTAAHRAGFPLVEQRGRRLRLTADGARVAIAALDVLAELSQLDSLIAEVRGGTSGGLRVLATSSVCNYMLPPVIGAMLTSAPDADLRIQAAAGFDIWKLFESGDFDVVIARSLPPPHISATHLFDDKLCLCVAPGSEVARHPVDWAAISRSTLIGPIGDDAMWGQFSLLGIRARSWVRVSDVTLAKRLVEDGHGIALLYRSVAQAEESAGRITTLPLPDGPLGVSYWMATRDHNSATLASRFTRLLMEHAARIGAQ